jgi:hypothetical protein
MATEPLSQRQAQQADLLTGAYLDQIEKEHSGRIQDLQQHMRSLTVVGLISNPA